MLVQLPLPDHIDEGRVLAEIDIAKDVENFIRDPEALAAAQEALVEREKTARALLSALE
ncbi:MAG TPA: hypothetical protein EYP04_05785, partial [Anaerolineae bacterium]|nr:hypothetical protein [Anaerolineae bacterium]